MGFSEVNQCFVPTRHRAADPGTRPSRLRSYSVPSYDFVPPVRHNWTIYQAACAAAATELFFKPFAIAHSLSVFEFEDASLFSASNPTLLAVEEMEQHELLKDRSIELVVSLGTGRPSPSLEQSRSMFRRSQESLLEPSEDAKQSRRLEGLAHDMFKLTSDSEKVHEAMKERYEP
jgi:hypothetical protein